jgi:hypothetical protein
MLEGAPFAEGARAAAGVNRRDTPAPTSARPEIEREVCLGDALKRAPAPAEIGAPAAGRVAGPEFVGLDEVTRSAGYSLPIDGRDPREDVELRAVGRRDQRWRVEKRRTRAGQDGWNTGYV